MPAGKECIIAILENSANKSSLALQPESCSGSKKRAICEVFLLAYFSEWLLEVTAFFIHYYCTHYLLLEGIRPKVQRVKVSGFKLYQRGIIEDIIYKIMILISSFALN
jgi:hypothetical protein